MNLRQQVLRPVSRRQSICWCFTSTSPPMLVTANLDPAVIEDEAIKEVSNIIAKDNPLEFSLEPLARNLSPRIVSSVVQNPPNPQSGFRFFIWATRRRQFRTWDLQESIFSMLVQEGGFDLYWKTLEELRDGKILIPSDAFRVLITGYWSIGDAEKAVEVFANRADDAQLLFYKMMDSGCQPDEVTYNSLLNEERRIPDLVLYSIMIRGFAEVGRIDDALHLMREMSNNGLVPDTQCYNALIKGYCNLGLLDEARSLELEISENDCSQKACTYTILICAMCEHGLVQNATDIFERMEKLGCSPSVVTFNSLIHGLCKAGQLEEAHLLFYKMEIGKTPSLFLRLSQGADRVHDSSSLQKLVERLCESGFYLKAYRLLTKLADNGVLPNIITYNILINGMCKRKNIHGAFKLLKELQLKGLSPDSITYGTLIEGLCRVDRENDAIRMLDQITDSGVLSSSSPYKSFKKWDNGLVKSLEDHLGNGDLVGAIGTMLEIDLKMKEFDLGPYTIWLIGLCQAGRVEEALDVFRVLEDYNINLTPPSCVVLIQSLCRQGKLDLAIDVLEVSQPVKSCMLQQPKSVIMKVNWSCICKKERDMLFVDSENLLLSFGEKNRKKLRKTKRGIRCYSSESDGLCNSHLDY
ncbi:hypothetical protein V2J09_017968 [Rumex salicifolius]